MQIFDGKKEARNLENIISRKVSEKPLQGFLGIVLIGEDAASEKYVGYKIALCDKFFIPWRLYRINSDLSDSDIETRFQYILSKDSPAGIIIQLPLPRESLYNLLDLSPLEKDLDLLSNKSMTQFRQKNAIFKPPVVRSLELFLLVNKIKSEGLSVKIVGGGRLVGEPIAYFLANNKANVTIMDGDERVKARIGHKERTKMTNDYNSGELIKAGLVVGATGQAELIKGEDLASGTHLVDFGSVVRDGKVLGNFDKHSRKEHLGHISLVPGGMGPLVVRYLLLNFLHA
jgi:methylenetetrahydrofolate dehydrogenase (NADP+)/methenyltetrahydrofolate cyclohydrolase